MRERLIVALLIVIVVILEIMDETARKITSLCNKR